MHQGVLSTSVRLRHNRSSLRSSPSIYQHEKENIISSFTNKYEKFRKYNFFIHQQIRKIRSSQTHTCTKALHKHRYWDTKTKICYINIKQRYKICWILWTKINNSIALIINNGSSHIESRVMILNHKWGYRAPDEGIELPLKVSGPRWECQTHDEGIEPRMRVFDPKWRYWTPNGSFVPPVLDLWSNQRGVSNVFLMNFWLNQLGVNENLWGLRGTRGG